MVDIGDKDQGFKNQSIIVADERNMAIIRNAKVYVASETKKTISLEPAKSLFKEKSFFVSHS